MSARNLHTLIVGPSSSGKTLLARQLIGLAARVVVCDREHEYNGIRRAHYAYTLRDACTLFLALRWEFFCLVVQLEDDEEYLKLLELLEYTQRTEPAGPLVIVLEEASHYGNINTIAPIVRDLYNKGRHRRISLLSIVQVDTDLHRVARSNSRIIVAMKSHKLSGDMRNWFEPEDVAGLSSPAENFTPQLVQGRHYLVHPPGIELVPAWRAAQAWLWRPKT